MKKRYRRTVDLPEWGEEGTGQALLEATGDLCIDQIGSLTLSSPLDTTKSKPLVPPWTHEKQKCHPNALSSPLIPTLMTNDP